MTEHQQTSQRFQSLLEELRHGNETARRKIIELSYRHFKPLAQKAMRGYPLVRRNEETDDLLQNSMIRLQKALTGTFPDTAGAYYSLVATLIRNELIEMGRKLLGRKQQKKNWISNNNNVVEEAVDPESKTNSFEKWIEFHEDANKLDQKHKEIFDLLYYQGVGQQETADLLGISKKTVQRRWKSIKSQLNFNFQP